MEPILLQASQRPTVKAVGTEFYENIRVPETATLFEVVPEPDNPYDPNAISIRYGGQTVGYISRSRTATYLPFINRIAASGKTAIVQGRYRRDEYGFINLHLYLLATDTAIPPNVQLVPKASSYSVPNAYQGDRKGKVITPPKPSKPAPSAYVRPAALNKIQPAKVPSSTVAHAAAVKPTVGAESVKTGNETKNNDGINGSTLRNLAIIIGVILCGLALWGQGNDWGRTLNSSEEDTSLSYPTSYSNVISTLSPEYSSPSSEPYNADRIMGWSDNRARYLCHDRIKQQLKSPSTAKFEGLFDFIAVQSADHKDWMIHGHVDAQNAFGATLRTNWTCTVTPIDEDNAMVDATLSEY